MLYYNLRRTEHQLIRRSVANTLAGTGRLREFQWPGHIGIHHLWIWQLLLSHCCSRRAVITSLYDKSPAPLGGCCSAMSWQPGVRQGSQHCSCACLYIYRVCQ